MRTFLAVVLLALATSLLADDPIQRELEAIQERRDAKHERQPTYIVYDRWPDRTPRTIFAAVPGGMGPWELVAFRVAKGGKLQQLAEYGEEKDITGIVAKDVDGDGKPEVLASEPPGNRSTPVEIVSWDGNAFHEIGETTGDAVFFDLDHDGLPEVITSGRDEENGCGAIVGRSYVSRLRSRKLEDESRPSLIAIDVQTKTSASPESVTYSWFLDDHRSTACKLHIVNGTRDGHRATGLELRLKPTDESRKGQGRIVSVALKGTDEYVDLPVQLPSRCTVATVTLRGPGGATIALVLETAGHQR